MYNVQYMYKDVCILNVSPLPSGLHANAETTVPSHGDDRVHTFCHCDNRCRTTCT